MSIQCYMTGQIPGEMSFKIFSNLGKKDLVKSAQVCKNWYQCTRLNELWIKFFPGIDFTPHGFEIKQQNVLGIYPVFSGTDLRIHFFRFLKELRIHQIGIFKCIFPFNPRHSLEIKVHFQVEMESLEKVQRICCYEGKLSNKNIQIFLEDDQRALINIEARMNPWANNFFNSAESLVHKRYLKLNNIESNKKPQRVNWTRLCLTVIVITYCITALISLVFGNFERANLSKENCCLAPSNQYLFNNQS